MPLEHGKSKEAFVHNLKAELKAGKPMKQGLAIAYSVKRRGKKMADGGMAHCAHGGPAYCNVGCYADGGLVEEMHPEHDASQYEDSQQALKQGRGYQMAHDEPMNSGSQEDPRLEKPNSIKPASMAKKAIGYEEGIDEPMDEANNMPRLEKPHAMDSMMAREEGDMESEDEPMKMAMGGMMNPKKMARAMMAAGGMVKNSPEAWQKAQDRQMALENQPAMGSDREDIDVAWTTPHDDNLSSEGDYPLMEEEGYTEGHQAKMRRKGGLLERVMSKIHSR